MTEIQIKPGQVATVPINMLAPDPDQPRKVFTKASLESLGESLKHRVHVPLLVRRNGEQLVIHDGERRFRAAQAIGLDTLPCLLVQDEDGEDVRASQVIVNELREKLLPMEIARVLADLQRKQFKSINDLHAHLEAQGMPPMKPAEIRNLIAMVDLPTWSQDMIDAGTLDPAAGSEIRKAEKWPAVMEAVKEGIEDDARFGRISKSEMKRTISWAFRSVGIDLDRTESWYHDRVLFDPAKVCKGCEFLVRFNGAKLCMNEDGFNKHQAEAREALAAKEKEEPDADKKKAGEREDLMERKAREYLHAYLIHRLERHMRGAGEGDQIDITDELLAWKGMDRPGAGWNMRGPVMPYDAEEETGIHGLDDLFKSKDIADHKLHAAIQVLREMPWEQTRFVAHELWGGLESVWRLDDGFLRLFRKAELVELAEKHDVKAPEGKAWGSMKLADLREELLAHGDKIRRPQLLVKVYDEE